jgi:hypothetical protein
MEKSGDTPFWIRPGLKKIRLNANVKHRKVSFGDFQTENNRLFRQPDKAGDDSDI